MRSLLICSKHFLGADFLKSSAAHGRLKRDAVPSVSVPRPLGAETAHQVVFQISSATGESENMPSTTPPAFCPIAAILEATDMAMEDVAIVVLNEEIVISSNLGTVGEIFIIKFYTELSCY